MSYSRWDGEGHWYIYMSTSSSMISKKDESEYLMAIIRPIDKNESIYFDCSTEVNKDNAVSVWEILTDLLLEKNIDLESMLTAQKLVISPSRRTFKEKNGRKK